MELLVVIIIAVVVVLVVRSHDKQAQIDKPPDAPVVKTYTFEPTGVTHKCVVPDRRVSRQTSLLHSRRGDPVTLQVYEWEGDPAIAVINARTGYDIGVADQAKALRALTKMMDQYNLRGVIEDFSSFTYKGSTYKQAIVRIECYAKQ